MSNPNTFDEPQTPQWSCDFAESIGANFSPIPIPIRVRDGLNYVEGAGGGFFDDEGYRLIGLPGGFLSQAEQRHITGTLAAMRGHLLDKFGPGLVEVDAETAAELQTIGQQPRDQ
jgi:hypothetical protein